VSRCFIFDSVIHLLKLDDIHIHVFLKKFEILVKSVKMNNFSLNIFPSTPWIWRKCLQMMLSAEVRGGVAICKRLLSVLG
jgi:hypothetical protein